VTGHLYAPAAAAWLPGRSSLSLKWGRGYMWPIRTKIKCCTYCFMSACNTKYHWILFNNSEIAMPGDCGLRHVHIVCRACFRYLFHIIIIIITYFNCKWGFTRWQWYYNKTQHTAHKITHHTQTKHSTQNYTNSKGHTTHNEYNENTTTTNTVTTTIILYNILLRGGIAHSV
jgi:hypothetical protein